MAAFDAAQLRMNRMIRTLVRPLIIGALALGLAAQAPAQETMLIDGVEATRIVIPPARSELARIIKAELRDRYYAARPETAEWLAAQKLYFFYAGRRFEPLWLVETPNGVAYSATAGKILGVFEDAGYQGFRPADYLTPGIDIGDAGNDPARLASVETAFSASAYLYARHAVGGRIAPGLVSRMITIRPTQIDPSELLVNLAAADNPDEMLLSLHPTHREFLALREQLARIAAGDVEQLVTIPDGELIKANMADARVPLLRERLNVPFPATDPLVFDETVRQALISFQESLGLIPDGVVGPATVAALNGTHGASAEDVVANMERWRWLPRDLSAFYVLVNVPEFRLEVHHADAVAYSTRVVVGQRTHQTPIFYDEIEHIVVNPYWNVPLSIASNEIAPLLRENPGYLANNNMELLYGGRVINASSVDWSETSVNNFRIRQRPGAGNALGNIKFLFPNQHDVYLHDTPSKSLFARSIRAFSHGCIRVQNPMDFADALLEYEPDLDSAKLAALFGSSERWVNIERHVPVYISYFTLRVSEDGTLRTYADIYGHNERLVNLLAR
ncbi:MAG: L,D-transpeptidase family protein [Cucumibacter sp.]